MSISPQLPPIALAQASASLRALAQAAGQTVEARILSQSSNGTAQVQIGRQTLNLALPEGQVVGSTLTLSVQQADGQLRLAIVAVRPPATTSVQAPQPGVIPTPATSVQLSAAALASSTLAQALPTSAPGAPPSAPPTAPMPAPSNPSVPGASVVSTVTAGARPLPGYGPPPVQGSQSIQGGVVPALPTASLAAPGGVAVGGVPASVEPGGLPSTTAAAPSGASGATGSSAVPLPGGASAGPVAGQPGAAATIGQPQAGATAPQTAGTIPAPPAPPGSVVQASAVGQQPVPADIPYAVAAPANTGPQVTAATGSTVSGLPPVAQLAAGTMVGQHAPSPNTPLPLAAGPGASGVAPGPVAPTAHLPGATPQSALAQMVQQAMSRQDSLVGLTTALTSIAGKVALPEPVAKAAQQVLGARLPLDGIKITGAGIKAAVQMSGVFQEALVASGQGSAAAGDLKSALLTLRQTLGAWLGNQTPVAQISGIAPPIRGHIPRAKGGDGAPPSLPDDPVELGKFLSERTDAALSRLRLHQSASLPDPSGHRQDAQWSMDLPVIVGGQQQVLHLQIQRDAEQEAERSGERSWQVRFAINLADRGEVGAQISMRAKNTGVLLWADREDTARSLAEAVDGLREELGGAGLVAGAIVVRAGAPAADAPQPSASAGHVLDATR